MEHRYLTNKQTCDNNWYLFSIYYVPVPTVNGLHINSFNYQENPTRWELLSSSSQYCRCASVSCLQKEVTTRLTEIKAHRGKVSCSRCTARAWGRTWSSAVWPQSLSSCAPHYSGWIRILGTPLRSATFLQNKLRMNSLQVVSDSFDDIFSTLWYRLKH